MAQTTFCFAVRITQIFPCEKSHIFLYSGNEVLYYKSSKDTTPLGHMNLQSANIVLGAKDTHFNIELYSEQAENQTPDAQKQAAASGVFKSPEKVNNSPHLQPLEQPKHVQQVWKLKAASRQDRQQWVDAIDKAIIFAKLNDSNQQLLHSPVQALAASAAAPFDSDSQYKKVQQHYLKRLSLPAQGIEALHAGEEAKPSPMLPPVSTPQQQQPGMLMKFNFTQVVILY